MDIQVTRTELRQAFKLLKNVDRLVTFFLSFLSPFYKSLLSYLTSSAIIIIYSKKFPHNYIAKNTFKTFSSFNSSFASFSCSLSSSISSFATLTCVSPRPTSEIPLFFDVLETGACSFYRTNLSSLSCST